MQIRYVNTASTAGGDGTTNNTSGTTRAYATLDEALTGLPGTLTDAYTIYCEGSAADTAPCYPNIVTSPTNYLLITTTVANRNTGKWESGRYRLEVTNASGIYDNLPEHLRIDGLQIQLTVTNGGSYVGIKTVNANQSGAAIDCRVSNTIVRGVETDGSIAGYTASPPGAGGAGTARYWNCLAIDCSYGFTALWTGLHLFNCTTGNCYYAFIADAAYEVINCLAGNTILNSFVGTFAGTSDYNAEDMGTTPPGAHSWTSTTFSFVNAGAGDYHLVVGDTGARGRAIADPGNGLFLDDIDGQTRGASWDIGADQYAAESGGGINTRRKRMDAAHILIPLFPPAVLPDLDIEKKDRINISGVYSGIFETPGIVRVYLSPRYVVETNRTRNILAQLITYPDSFEEIVNVSRGFGICIVYADQATHDGIIIDGRATPLSVFFTSQELFASGLSTTLSGLTTELKTNKLTKLEEKGINTAWSSDSNTVREILRYAFRAISLVQILTGENKAQATEFFQGSLDLTMSQFSTAIQTEVTDWMISKGLAVGWITGTTTVREIEHFIEENFDMGILTLAGEEF